MEYFMKKCILLLAFALTSLGAFGEEKIPRYVGPSEDTCPASYKEVTSCRNGIWRKNQGYNNYMTLVLCQNEKKESLYIHNLGIHHNGYYLQRAKNVSLKNNKITFDTIYSDGRTNANVEVDFSNGTKAIRIVEYPTVFQVTSCQ